MPPLSSFVSGHPRGVARYPRLVSDQANHPAAKPGPASTRRVRRRTSSKRTGARPDSPEEHPPQPIRPVDGPRDSYDLADGSKENDHGVRALIGSGPSQIRRIAAMRARDINRPTDEEIEAAEADVEVVRRNWKPPTR